MAAKTQYHFKVMWKRNIHPKAPSVTQDYMAANLGELMDTLRRSESVTVNNTEFLYVHRIDPNKGEPVEVMAHEQATGLTVTDFRDESVKGGGARRRVTKGTSVVEAVARVLEDTRKEMDKKPKEITAMVPVGKPTKPRIRLKAPDTRPHIVSGNGLYKAYEA